MPGKRQRTPSPQKARWYSRSPSRSRSRSRLRTPSMYGSPGKRSWSPTAPSTKRRRGSGLKKTRSYRKKAHKSTRRRR